MSGALSFRLQVLGAVTVRRSTDAPGISLVTQPRPLALLCYLALARPRGLQSRDVVMALLWPRHSEQRARRALRNALHELRRTLGTDLVTSAGDNLIGVDARLLSCDVLELERGDWPPDAASSREGFDGFHVEDARPFANWLDGERRRLQGLVARRLQSTHTNESPTITLGDPAAERRGGDSAPHHQGAHALYVRGHYLFMRTAHGGNADDLHRSRDYFERALKEDPRYAPALAGLANYYAVAARRELLTPFETVFARTIALSHEALAIDATLAPPHVHFAVQAWYLNDQLDRAGEQFAAAVACEPAYAEGRRFYGAWLLLMGRAAEALHQMEEAARLEPDIPHVLSSLAAAQLAMNHEAAAELTLRQVLALDARHGAARERLLRLYERQGRLGDALELRASSANAGEALEFVRGWEQEREVGYERVRRARLEERAAALEVRLLEQRAAKRGESSPRRAADIFSPPEIQLIGTYAELGDWKRVRRRELEAVARRPALATWIAAIPELRHRPDR